MLKVFGFFALLCVVTLLKANAKTERYLGTAPLNSHHADLQDDEVGQVLQIQNNDAAFNVAMGQKAGYKITCAENSGMATLFVYPEMKSNASVSPSGAKPMRLDLRSYPALTPKFGSSVESCQSAKMLLDSASVTAKVKLKFKDNAVSIEAAN